MMTLTFADICILVGMIGIHLRIAMFFYEKMKKMKSPIEKNYEKNKS